LAFRAAAAALLWVSPACTQGRDVVATSLIVSDAGHASDSGAATRDSEPQAPADGGMHRAPDATVPAYPDAAFPPTGFGARGPDAGSPCEGLISTYEALQYVVENNCELPPLAKLWQPVIDFASLYPSSRMGETRAPTYCDLAPGNNSIYYSVPDAGTTKLCPFYCDLAQAWIRDGGVRTSYQNCRFGSH